MDCRSALKKSFPSREETAHPQHGGYCALGQSPRGLWVPLRGGPSPSVRSFGHPRTSRALRPRRGRIPLFTSVLLSLSPDRFEPSPRKHSSCTVIRLGFLLLVHLDPTGHKAMTARNPRARLELNRRRARLGRRTEHARARRRRGERRASSRGSGTRRGLLLGEPRGRDAAPAWPTPDREGPPKPPCPAGL